MHRLLSATLFVALLSPIPSFAAGLDAPDQGVIGSKIDVTWDAPGNRYDAVWVSRRGDADDVKGQGSASITGSKNPIQVTLPEVPGTYELRYWLRDEKRVLTRRPIEVVDVPTSLDAVESANAGESIDVAWEGPGNRYDRILVVPAGSPDDAEAVAKVNVHGRSPVKLRLPETAGNYELRYQTYRIKRILAKTPLTILSVSASLEAPEVAQLGEEIQVHWEGPGNQYDWVGLYPVGGGEVDKPIVRASIVSQRNPVRMKLPEDPGDYELQYVTYQDRNVLHTRPITVGAVDASLDAPDSATAATKIEVRWTGPGNNYDRIALYPVGAPDDAESVAHRSILRGKNPILLHLPEVEGNYELRYVLYRSKRVLARRPLELGAAGRLSVIFEGQGETITRRAGDGVGAVEIILDASGSMLKKENGVRRIDIARQVLDNIVKEHLPEQGGFALRIFGHKEADSCRTDLEIPFGPLDRGAAADRIASVQAMNLAKTPIADSLAKVSSDLAAAKGPKTVILITDGEETCDGDPATAIQELRDQGIDAQVSIVGFAIDDDGLRSDFETWAQLGGGSYFDARSADELTRSLTTVISGPFRVLGQGGKVVAQGVIGGAPVILPAGTYRVETLGKSPQVLENVVVKSKEETQVHF